MAVAAAARRMVASTHEILICCGAGFNGGDGLAAARHLLQWSSPLRIVLTAPMDRLREEPAVYARILRHLGTPLQSVTSPQQLPEIEPMIQSCDLIIDALLGIGALGAVREPTASLIDALNRSGKPILAVDVPSGLDADTGAVQGKAVKATQTVTFGRPKRGLLLNEGPAHAGALTVDSITIPEALLRSP